MHNLRVLGLNGALAVSLLTACGSDGVESSGGSPAPAGTSGASGVGGDMGAASPNLTAIRQCTEYHPNRSLYFGDMHVHTSYSFDAYGYGTRTDPAGAYAYAKGAKVDLATPNGSPQRTSKLRRPLDFTAVTDHSEHFGQYPPGMWTGANPAHDAWQHEQMAANEANDSTASCNFAALIAYEWTGEVGGNWYHRNVIFRNSHVPTNAISYKDKSTPQGLWSALKGACLEAGTGCDVISIPHNSNYSAGNMFTVPDTISASEAATRATFEPLAEIYQHKGNSECKVGVQTDDPFCQFYDKFPTADCTKTPSNNHCKPGNFVRNALRRGLEIEEKVGVNPLKLGIIADTDTHNGTPGATDEFVYQGQKGKDDATPLLRVDGGDLYGSAGGLVAVWAEERSRDAIFVALRRRETYATSGTRPRVRFFGGWNLPTNLCTQQDLVSVGYAQGVPMGGNLPAAPSKSSSPTFVVSAMKDPGTTGHPGTKLMVAQIIKGWEDPSTGKSREKVYDVAGDANNGATVDRNTCETSGPGADSLCAVWKDPNFSPSQHAFYYVRVLENPTCSVNQYDCNQIPAAQRPATCSNGELPMVVHHRAWTSPIWYKHP